MISWARATFRVLSASMPRSMAFSTMPAMTSMSSWISESCLSNPVLVMIAVQYSGPLAKPSGDVVLSAPVPWVRENLVRDAVLYQPPGALFVHEHERRVVGNPRRLLHVVGDDDDRVVLHQL